MEEDGFGFGVYHVLSERASLDFPGGANAPGILLPMQEPLVQSLVQEDSTWLGATKSLRHNY